MNTEVEFMLTTFDNPFDYFTDFIKWRMYDIQSSQENNRPLCCEYLARVVAPKLEDDMTQKERDEVIEAAIDEIIENDFRNIYKKISNVTEVIEPLNIVS